MRFTDLHTTLWHRQRERMGPRLDRRWGIIASSLALLLVITGCTGEQSMFDPSGTGAQSVDRLWWIMLGLGTFVFALVLVALGVAIFSGSRTDEPRALSRKSRHRVVLLGGVVMPLAILTIVFMSTLESIRDVVGMGGDDALVVDVVGHQYWWEVTYPDHGISTANEVYIPVDRPVEINLTSSDVIHSFWIPQLHGTLDMMPGSTTTLNIEAVEAGTYRGQCNQFCGLQHANMAFYVYAQEGDEFEEWAAQRAEPASEPPSGSVIERGYDVYMSSACVFCHTIDGTNSQGTLGPDLTHLASRETLAAGMLENNFGNLSAWIVDPQQLKPGAQMPAANLSGEELQALLAYLNSLD